MSKPASPDLQASARSLIKAFNDSLPTIAFERYEVWITPGLGDDRILVSTDALDLESAMEQGDLAAKDLTGHGFAAINYVALHDLGRTERFWVREVTHGVWKELGAPEIEPQSL